MWATPIAETSNRRTSLRLTPISERPAEQWRAQAACQGLSSALFHPVDAEGNEDEGALEMAKAVCNKCRVRQSCLEYALTAREMHGVWGGLSARERRRILRRRRKSA